MKKAKIKLNLNKNNISNLKTTSIKGGVSGTTCNKSEKYHETCYDGCYPNTWWAWGCDL